MKGCGAGVVEKILLYNKYICRDICSTYVSYRIQLSIEKLRIQFLRTEYESCKSRSIASAII